MKTCTFIFTTFYTKNHLHFRCCRRSQGAKFLNHNNKRASLFLLLLSFASKLRCRTTTICGRSSFAETQLISHGVWARNPPLTQFWVKHIAGNSNFRPIFSWIKVFFCIVQKQCQTKLVFCFWTISCAKSSEDLLIFHKVSCLFEIRILWEFIREIVVFEGVERRGCFDGNLCFDRNVKPRKIFFLKSLWTFLRNFRIV